MAYERRLAILGTLGDIKSAKRQFKDQIEELQGKKKMLFGTEFQKHLKTVTKAQEHAETFFTDRFINIK